MKTKLTKKELIRLLEPLSDDAPIYYHSYDHGCCLNSYRVSDVWMFPKDSEPKRALVLNPGNDWDGRQAADRA